jgi:hypothetical protein
MNQTLINAVEEAITFAWEQLKGGGQNMGEEQLKLDAPELEPEPELELEDSATMCPTKAGFGFKVVVNGIWFYAAKRKVLEMVNGQRRVCTFTRISDSE